MSREEAINNINMISVAFVEPVTKEQRKLINDTFDIAIKALEQEPKTGHWIDVDGDNAICGCCNRLNRLYGDYCKHCGAKMIEPQESEGIYENF